MQSLRRCRYCGVLRKRRIQYKGGRQIGGCQRLLNRTNCLGLSRFCSSLCLEKEFVFLAEKTHIVTVYMKIKVTAIQEDIFTSRFLSEKINQQSEKDHGSITSPLHLPPYMVPWVLTWTKT